MPSFTAEQLDNIYNSTLDFYMKKGKPQDQHIQDKPLLSLMRKKMKSIPGGKGRVEMPISLETQTTLVGFQNDDSVSYGSPAKNKRVSWPYALFHAGIKYTMDELLRDGISVTDSTTGGKTSNHSDRELIMVANIFQEKIRDMNEGYDSGMNQLFWRDGTQSAIAFPGVTGIVVDDPTDNIVVGGVDQHANPKWRNRADLNITLGDTTGASQAVLRKLDYELPQLRRYGGKPSKAFAGSDMIDRLKAEYRAKGVFTQEGWAKSKDLAAGDISFGNLDIMYDPTLDDLGYQKRLYVLDLDHMFPFAIEDEDGKMHNPARPEDKYVFYKAKTFAGGMACNQRNGNGVYAFA